jgi:hypothetical protein
LGRKYDIVHGHPNQVWPIARQIEASYDKNTDERRKKSKITILFDLRLDF